MGFEQEAVTSLMTCMRRKRSKMQRDMVRGNHGEPFVLHELMLRGTMTPSQVADALCASSGRVSTLLSALEKKGFVTRDVDPDDRRVVHVNLTPAGREKAHADLDEMRDAMCWIFSQMGERRTREFVDLLEEFATYMSICHPGKPRPTPEEVREAFAERAGSGAEAGEGPAAGAETAPEAGPGTESGGGCPMFGA
ncbi:MarR family winged helix-turn-helix transcriptional regulator [Bifidobacterium avesanii]|uniref:MarR family transcriptional regulator n=1 Tax=Bifidobacterium avesanii TaxID=1798157 RepID=A0A7K3TFF4_9BIFI|nr:transcriptional regulator [Bifidobacterium avesanii]KAB8294340.1 MarR family transcriptional regulator [Bifidobacterium avesanii]NEG77825.1 MarR family transcriptional regulator [Bifidobacterium avesanii]